MGPYKTWSSRGYTYFIYGTHIIGDILVFDPSERSGFGQVTFGTYLKEKKKGIKLQSYTWKQFIIYVTRMSD